MRLILNKIIFMEAIWSPRRPSILPDPHDHVSPSEGMFLGLLVANHWCSSPGNLWICYSSWQRGAWDGTKDTDLEMKSVFGSSSWDYLITWILESEGSSQAEVQRKKGSSRRKLKHRPVSSSPFGDWRRRLQAKECRWSLEGAKRLPAGRRTGTWLSPQIRTSKEAGTFLKSPKRNAALPTTWFEPSETHVTSDIQGWTIIT